jgi:hypothetical protein
MTKDRVKCTDFFKDIMDPLGLIKPENSFTK